MKKIDEIVKAFTGSRTEYKTIVFVCIFLLIITLLLKFGPYLLRPHPVPFGSADTLSKPVLQEKPLTLKEMDELGIP